MNKAASSNSTKSKQPQPDDGTSSNSEKTTSPPGANQIEVLDQGRLRVTAAFGPLLAAHGLCTFEKIMALPVQEIARSFPGRNTVRLELRHPAGEIGGFYLKRYERGYLSPWKFLLRALRWPGAPDEAMREWTMLRALSVAGFNTAIPVAVGQEETFGVVTRSFVMTAEIAQGVCAHDCVPALDTPRRRMLARKTGELTRRFHEAGFVHKDYYLYHLFVVGSQTSAPNPELYLIDLQRVVRPRYFRERWRIKDLSALAYSALRLRVPRTDLMRFFMTYRAKTSLDARDKLLALKILRRVQWLRRRRPKHDTAFAP